MKLQYLGDESDYRKFALLRFLAKHCDLTIGVCWMLSGPDGRSDGKLRKYATEPIRWRRHDFRLFDYLKTIPERPKAWDLRRVQYSHILGPKTKFVDTAICRTTSPIPSRMLCLTCNSDGSNACNKTDARDRYMRQAFRQLQDQDLIFFDPDNGIEVKSQPSSRTTSSHKHLYLREILPFWRNGSSILIYQHWDRRNHDITIAQKREEVASSLGISQRSLYVFRTNSVMFLLIPNIRHRRSIEFSLNRKWRWPKHFIQHEKSAAPILLNNENSPPIEDNTMRKNWLF